MIQPYFEVFFLIVGGGKLQNIEDSSLVILGYQLLPLVTSKLMGDNKEFNDSAIFWGVLLIVGGWKLQNIEDSSLGILGYQLLPLASSKSMGDNKEFNDSAIFWGVFSHCWWRKTSEYWRFIIGDPWLPIVAPSNQ